jgi:hypothetical protein
MKLPPRLRAAGLVLAALALPVALAAATWTMTATSLGATVGLEDRSQLGPAAPATTTTTTTAPPTDGTSVPTTTAPGPSGGTVCDEPDEDRCPRDDGAGGHGSDRGYGGDD